MNETTIFGIVAAVVVTIIGILYRHIDRRAGSGTGSDTGSVRDNIEAAGRRNRDLEDAERATSDRLREQAGTIERAGRDNQDAQDLVQKAKHILANAQHTD